MENLQKPQTVKIGGWVLAQVWALARDNTVLALPTHFHGKLSLMSHTPLNATTQSHTKVTP